MIILLVFGGISIAIWLIWGKKSLRTLKSASSDQSSPKSRLTRHEKKLRHQAGDLYRSGKYQAAAQVLESIGLVKNAVSILEEKGLVREACKILLRHGHVETAAVIYARNRLWDLAAENFGKADKQLEAAQCYREAGKPEQAAQMFESLKNYQAAAKCYADAGDLRKAGENFLHLKKLGHAMPYYQELYQKDPEAFIKIRFASEETRAFRSWLKKEKWDLYLARALGYRKKLRPLLLDLAKEGRIKTGIEILRMVQGPYRDEDIPPKLVSEVSYESAQAKYMAEILTGGGEIYYAGVIYEKLEEFLLAAKSYEKAGDAERAKYCYSRAGQTWTEKPGEAVTPPPPSSPVPEPKANAGFSQEPASSEAGPSSPEKKLSGISAGVFSLEDVSEVYEQQSEDEEDFPGNEEPLDADMVEKFTNDLQKSGEEKSDPEDSGDALLHLQFSGKPATRSGSSLSPAELNFSYEKDDTLIDQTLNMNLDLTSVSESDREVFYGAKIFDKLTRLQKDSLLAMAEIEELLTEDILMLSRQNGSGLYIVLKGWLVANANQSVQLEKNRKSGDSLGEAFVFSDINIPETFLAKKESLICHIASVSISQLLNEDPVMARQLYKNYTNHLLQRLFADEEVVYIQDDS